MSETAPAVGSFLQLEKPQLQVLIDTLQSNGYRVIGPRLRDGAVVLDDLASVDQLPRGWLDDQEGGSYRLAGIRKRAGSITSSAPTRSSSSFFLLVLRSSRVSRSATPGNSAYRSPPSGRWQ